ncbi:binding partner of ACD11 1 [Eucalyptus grandis]|uniref:binding partner of ACD11 1 n=1 Tax=Eucalyptus grandis TaxID=71139 RepID=UPI00192E97FD|nr:binding partner of ACD11 1 [Eucalyptus grandis]
MQVSEDNAERKNGSVPESIMTPNWTINVSEIKTIKVSNISPNVSDRDVREFFSFSGDIQHVEMRRESESSQLAYVTFKEAQGADTAMLLSGATIADLCVSITPVDDYQLPPEALPSTPEKKPTIGGDAIKKAEDVVSSMLAAGFVLGKDVMARAKALDEQHHWTSSASATVASIGGKIGLGERLGAGTTIVTGKVKEMDERLHVSEMTRSALAMAEQIKAGGSAANSSIMSNRYVSTGASWVSSALETVVKVAEDVSNMTKEKVEKAEEGKTVILGEGEAGKGGDAVAATHVHVVGSPGGAPIVPLDSRDTKLGII